MMKQYPALQSASRPSVVVYGGHPSLIAPLVQKLPGMLRVISSTRHAVDTRSFYRYKLVVVYTTNISHSSYSAVCSAARRANVPVHTMTHKGSTASAQEILSVLNSLA